VASFSIGSSLKKWLILAFRKLESKLAIAYVKVISKSLGLLPPKEKP
jgi:hypothetical protein